jgi:hypothetical protein
VLHGVLYPEVNANRTQKKVKKLNLNALSHRPIRRPRKQQCCTSRLVSGSSAVPGAFLNGENSDSSVQGRVYDIKFNQQSWHAAQATYFESDHEHDSLSSMSLPNDDPLDSMVRSGWLGNMEGRDRERAMVDTVGTRRLGDGHAFQQG